MMTSISDSYAGPLAETMSIVHDLRTPLSTIHGSAELLLGGELSDVQVRRLAQNLYQASIRMNELLEECLVRCRRTEQRRTSWDVGELIDHAVAEVRAGAQHQSVHISQRLPENLMIVADGLRVRRIFVNLLVNSLDAMPGGGAITISALGQNRTVLIRFSDTGPGISPEIRDRLFQPFATAGKPNGLGLGLASSRRALIEHGGEIWTEDTARGACFVLSLPRAPNVVRFGPDPVQALQAP
jgi:signal transduction histidine kinase